MDPWTDRLSDYIDDELAAPERRELEAHLTACNECRSAVAELRAVVARASTVATLSPETDLWPGVERRIREVRPPRRVSLSLPQVAAAALLLMALSGGLVWMLRSPTVPPARQAGASTVTSERAPVTAVPVSFPDETYAQAVIDLQRALEQGRHRLDPGTVLVIEQNLAAIDAAIVQAQRALESDPSNTYLNTHLVQARQRKLALLRRVNAMADPEG